MDLKHRAQPTLSICMAGRDDDYMLDFRYRLETTLNSYAHALQSLNREAEAEIVVTDWGSETPLCKTLELSEPARKIARFVYVPQEIIRKTQGGEVFYHVPRACNVGMRRARGKYVFVTNTDQLVPTSALESLLRLLNGEIQIPVDILEIIMLVPRVQVPWQFVERKPTLVEWEQFMFMNEYALLHQPHPPESNWFGSTSGFVFSAAINRELHGFDEMQAGWGWGDIEFGFRAIQERLFVHLSNLGISAFHMGHPPSGRRHGIVPTNSLTWDAAGKRNADNWGLGEYPLEVAHSLASGFGGNVHSAGALNSTEVATRTLQEMRSQKTFAHTAEVLSKLSVENGIDSVSKHSTLHFLSWYSLFRYPRTYLEIGEQRGESSVIVTSACPTVQICIARQMQGEIPGAQLTTLLHSLVSLGHKGYVHLLNCDIDDVLVKLTRLTPVFSKFDLVYTNLENVSSREIERIIRLLTVVSPDGALVFRCGTKSDFQAKWAELKAKVQDSCVEMYRAGAEPVGMLLKREGMAKEAGHRALQEYSADFDLQEISVAAQTRKKRTTLFRAALKGVWNAMEWFHDRIREMS